jgi:hypothetical protein
MHLTISTRNISHHESWPPVPAPWIPTDVVTPTGSSSLRPGLQLPISDPLWLAADLEEIRKKELHIGDGIEWETKELGVGRG